jgi:hypothetical protein
MEKKVSLFRMTHKDGYHAMVHELEIDSETVYDVYIENELFYSHRSFRIVKRNGIWLKHQLNVEDGYYTVWGNMIEEFLENNPVYGTFKH